MDDFRYQLVLQLPGDSIADFDALMALEDSLIKSFRDSPHQVDGHDFGSGTMNLFIDTNDPSGAFALAATTVSPERYPMLRAACRLFSEDEYRLIWPQDSKEGFELF